MRSVLFVAAAPLLALLIWSQWFRPLSFNSADWKKEKHRWRMEKDLEHKIIAERWSRQRVISELGIDRAPGIYPIIYEPGCYAAIYGLDDDHTFNITIGPEGVVTGVEVTKQEL